jgi:putative oxidoreductase
MTKSQSITLGLLRAVTGFLYMQHGAQKLFGFPVPSPTGTFPLLSFMGFAGALELVGGFLILIGLFTRPVAFVLSGQMAVAYFMVHAPHGFWPIANGGDESVLLCFLFLFLASVGGGAWSLDEAWNSHQEPAPVAST